MVEWIIVILIVIVATLISYGIYLTIDSYRMSKDYNKFLTIINEHGYSFDERGHLRKGKENQV